MPSFDVKEYKFQICLDRPISQGSDNIWKLSWVNDFDDGVDFEFPADILISKIEHYSHRWSMKLDNYYQGLELPDHIAAFDECFSGDSPTITEQIEESLGLSGDELYLKKLLGYMVFYYGLLKFLHRDNRYEVIGSHTLYLLTAWQVYNLYKELLLFPVDESAITPTERYRIITNFARAHRTINEILSNDIFAQSLYSFRQYGGFIDLSGPLFRERMFVSLPLVFKAGSNEFSLSNPIPAPGLKADLKASHWPEVKIHPMIQKNPGGETAVRNLIAEKLLTRYDYGTAIRLSYLLKRQDKWWAFRLLPFSVFFALIWVFVASIFVTFTWTKLIDFIDGFPPMIMLLNGSLDRPDNWNFLGPVFRIPGPWILSLIIWIGPLFLVIVGFFMLERHILPHLILPRLIGGITLANLTILLEGGAENLLESLWSSGWVIIHLIFFSVLIIGFAYLYMDVRPLVRDKKVARVRSWWVLLIAFFLSAGWGLLSGALLTGSSDFECIPLGAECIRFFSLFGWVDLSVYLVIVPVTFLTGLVAQFLFEEKTVTSPIWASEEH